MNWLSSVTMQGIDFLSTLLVFSIAVLALVVLVLFVIDSTQKRDAVRHNFPVIGRFRSLFTHLGEFFRQYFFALDREEMPFNRAERDWIYLSSTGEDNNEPFGSTNNQETVGSQIFVNAGFPTLDEDAVVAPPVVFGPDTKNPYAAKSLINISAMSYGSLSRPAIQALSRGANLAECWLNTGEGGLSPYHLEGDCDIIFQIGTAKFGARDKAGNFSPEVFQKNAGHPNVKMIEVKLAQGAKPGKGGILPAKKINAEIAEIRGVEMGKDAISPNRHPEIENFDDLLDFIGVLRKLSGKPVGIKTVMGDESWIDDLCTTIKNRGTASAPDFITVDGGNGGTGAAPMALMDNVGLTLKEALPMLVDGLVRHDLRDRIKVVCAGKLVTPADVAWAYCVGTDVVNTARGFMFALGCIQAMRCHQNTCPTGITTHDRGLQDGLNPADKSVRVKNFVKKIEKDVNIIAHSCGVPHPRALSRRNVRLMQASGRSICLHELYPEPDKSKA